MNAASEVSRLERSLFQVRGGGSTPTRTLQLHLDIIDASLAKKLNRLWHSRLPRIGDPLSVFTAGVCYGAVYDGRWYAVAIWTHPVSRLLPQQWLELRRLAIAPDAPKNTASRMLAVMASLIRKAFPDTDRLISYQDTEVHSGGIYRAAGWIPTDVRPAAKGDWNNKNRPRPLGQSLGTKQRWELVLRPHLADPNPH